MDRGKRKINRICKVALLISGGLMQSCFTGVEGTPAIELSRKDRNHIAVSSPEESFLGNIHGEPLEEWDIGKQFHVMDPRVFLVFDRRSLPAGKNPYDIDDAELVYLGTDHAVDMNGNPVTVLLLSANGNVYRYNLTDSQTKDPILSTGLPMLSDSDAVRAVGDSLNGRQLWTRSSLWYTRDGVPSRGAKYVKVTVTDVVPGNRIFPLAVVFTDENGNERMMYMNLDDRSSSSRRFHTLFSFQDPAESYPDISPQVWTLIQRGEVREGMTKNECRLSLGSPQDVNQGHTQSYMLDLWQYSNGITLFFEDGLLKEFHK